MAYSYELTYCELTSVLMSSVGSFFSYVKDARSHETESYVTVYSDVE